MSKTHNTLRNVVEPIGSSGSLHPVVGRIVVANPLPVPREVAVCPECNGKLWWQVTTSDGLRDLDLDCHHDTRNNPHRNWQGEWEGIYAAVRRWIRKTYSPNDELTP